MGGSPVLVAAIVLVALILVQLALIALRNAVRGRLFPVTTDAPRPVAVGASTRHAAALHRSTRHSGVPSLEE